jgi:hypothetical protein
MTDREKPKRKDKGPGCPRCRARGYEADARIDPSEGKNRPSFYCTSCEHYWTSGRDGMPYIEFARPLNIGAGRMG